MAGLRLRESVEPPSHKEKLTLMARTLLLEFRPVVELWLGITASKTALWADNVSPQMRRGKTSHQHVGL